LREKHYFKLKFELCEFDHFNVMFCVISRRNILQHINSTYLKNCTFNRKTDPHCPIFRLGDIVTEAGEDFSVIALKVCIFNNTIQLNQNYSTPIANQVYWH